MNTSKPTSNPESEQLAFFRRVVIGAVLLGCLGAYCGTSEAAQAVIARWSSFF